jgi:transcriptional regulator with XRE-family HTH domain
MSHKPVPVQVERALEELGYNIRKARVRRNISLKDMADRLGVHRSVLSDVENGKPGTSIAAYAGMLWAMDLLPDLQAVADPEHDSHGLALASHEERERASSSRGMDNDF